MFSSKVASTANTSSISSSNSSVTVRILAREDGGSAGLAAAEAGTTGTDGPAGPVLELAAELAAGSIRPLLRFGGLSTDVGPAGIGSVPVDALVAAGNVLVPVEACSTPGMASLPVVVVAVASVLTPASARLAASGPTDASAKSRAGVPYRVADEPPVE